jgi:hypothetical protein
MTSWEWSREWTKRHAPSGRELTTPHLATPNVSTLAPISNNFFAGSRLSSMAEARRITYSGIRVTLGGTLSRAVVRFHVDVNVGDPIWPEPLPRWVA